MPQPEVQLVGRFADVPGGGKRFGWSASSIAARFFGTGVSVDIEELASQPAPLANFYDVSVDGGRPESFAATAGDHVYPLAHGLTPGEHQIFLRKRTEARVGEAIYHGLKLEGGNLLAWVPPVSRRLFVIGDSITAGYGDEGTSSTCPFSPATENVSRAYPVVAADALAAEVTVVAWSARGVWRNESGTTTETMSQLWSRALPTDPNSVWDPKLWIPDVIVVNLGTNDFALGVPPQDLFEQAYARLLSMLREQYSVARILVVLGPLLSDADPPGGMHLSVAREYLRAAIDSTGDHATYLLEVSPLAAGQEGCNGHPNILAHAALGAQLAQEIARLTGW